MELSSLPIEVKSSRDAGTGQQIAFRIVGEAADALRALLTALPIGAEVSAADPSNLDCALETRRTSDGFEIKRGCHGAYGTWQKSSLLEAINWLLPGTGSMGTDQLGLLLWLPRQ